MRVVLLIIVIAVFAVVGAFAVFNSGVMNPPGVTGPPTTTVHFFGEHRVTVSLLGLISFGAGVLSVIIFALAEEVRLRSRNKRLNKEIRAMRKEINALRNLPLASEILAKEAEEAEEER